MRVRRLAMLLLVGALAAAPGPATAAGAWPQLARVLRTAKDYKQRLAAAIGLARLNDRQAVPALVEALGDPQATVRGTAAGALGKLGDARATPALEALLQREKDPFVLRSTQTALANILRGAPITKPRNPDEMQVDGTVGTLDAQAAEDGVQARLPRVTTCYTRERSANPDLIGRLDLKIRVTAAGKVRWVHLERSDLGSLSAERCILAELARAKFAAPDGGEAEFKISIALSPQSVGVAAGAPPAPPGVPAEARKLLKACKKLVRPAGSPPLVVPPGLLLTFYVDAEGEILSAGLSAPGGLVSPELGSELVTRIKAFKLPARDDAHVIKVVTPFACSR